MEEIKSREVGYFRLNIFILVFLTISIVTFCLVASYKLWINKDIAISASQPQIQQNIETSSDKLNLDLVESVFEDKLNPEFVISDGDTLASILEEANVTSSEASALISAFSKKFNPRKLNIGSVVNLSLAEKPDKSSLTLTGMLVTINGLKKIEVKKDRRGIFIAQEILTPLIKKLVSRKVTINNSFNATALELAIPNNILSNLVRAFSYDIDFQRDIKKGSKFEVVLEQFHTEDGKTSHTGNVLYSALTIANKKFSLYQFIHPDGTISYYNENGENIKKEFLRTPVNAAKITSKFGMREHPVSGYHTWHKGIDFAAPIGTPILAAGTGIVEQVLHSFAGYGKYIKIKHNNKYSTVYGHASRFANGLKPGSKVTQGQVIAYVGVTGVTTGPHLHYEVLENGKQINPLKLKLSSSNDKLTGKLLQQFIDNKKYIAKYLAS